MIGIILIDDYCIIYVIYLDFFIYIDKMIIILLYSEMVYNTVAMGSTFARKMDVRTPLLMMSRLRSVAVMETCKFLVQSR